MVPTKQAYAYTTHTHMPSINCNRRRDTYKNRAEKFQQHTSDYLYKTPNGMFVEARLPNSRPIRRKLGDADPTEHTRAACVHALKKDWRCCAEVAPAKLPCRAYVTSVRGIPSPFPAHRCHSSQPKSQGVSVPLDATERSRRYLVVLKDAADGARRCTQRCV